MASSVASNPNYLPQAYPAKEIRVGATNLFRVAAIQLGDATLWYLIAELNGLTDPWIMEPTTLLIPQPEPSNGGILTPA